MSITNVEAKGFTTTEHRNSAQSCLEYLEDETPHNADDFITSRNLLKSSNYGDLLPIIKRQQKKITCRSYKPDKKTGQIKEPVQAYSIVQSFDREEFNYSNPDDVQKAHTAGVRLAQAIDKATGGNHAWQVFTQADNENHILHNHVVMLNYDRNQKAMQHGISWKNELAPLSDEIVESLLTTPKQRQAHEKTKKGMEIASNRSTKEARQARQTKHQQQLDYIRRVVLEVKNKATDANQFSAMLKDKGIEIQARNKKQNNAFTTDEAPKWYTKSGRPRKAITFSYQGAKMRSNRLNLTPEQLLRQFHDNMLKRQQQRQRQARIEKQADQNAKISPKEQPKQPIEKRQKPSIAKPQKPTNTKALHPTKPTAKKKTPKENQAPKSGGGINPYIAELQRELKEYTQKLTNAKTKHEKEVYMEKVNHASLALGKMESYRAVNETAKAQQEQKQKEDATAWGE